MVTKNSVRSAKLSLACCLALLSCVPQDKPAPAPEQPMPAGHWTGARNDHPFLITNGGFEDGLLTGGTVNTYRNPGVTIPVLTRANLNLGAGGTVLTSVYTAPQLTG